MGYSGPGCGILSLVVTERHVWCLDFKGALYCSSLSNGSLSWQKYEENVQQVALSPSGKQSLFHSQLLVYDWTYFILQVV